MRIYDPADRIVYVHLAQEPTPPRPPEACHRLPAGYPNARLRARLDDASQVVTRPALVVLPGGSTAADHPAPPVPALRLAQ